MQIDVHSVHTVFSTHCVLHVVHTTQCVVHILPIESIE